MNRKRAVTVAVLVAALAVLASVPWWPAGRRDQAVYQGRATSYWRKEIRLYLHSRQHGLMSDTFLGTALGWLWFRENRNDTAFRLRYPPLTQAGPPLPPDPDPRPARDRLAVVLELIEDRDPGVRAYAAAFLADAPAAATRLLDDPAPDVRLAAVLSLTEGGPAAIGAVEKLSELMGHTAQEYHVHAAGALWRIQGRPDAEVPVLAKALRGPDELHRQRAMSILREMKSEAEGAFDELCATSKDGDRFLRMYALRLLGTFGKRSVPALRDGLKDADATVRAWAAEALGQLGPVAVDAAGDLERVRDTATGKHLGETARQALNQIDPRRFPAK
jgi:hypothetical protein